MNSFEGKDYIGHTGNIQELSRKFLGILSSPFNYCELTLYLKDGDDNFRAILKRKGRINLSGEIIHEILHENIASPLADRDNLLSEDRKICYVSVYGPEGMYGAVKIQTDSETFTTELIRLMIAESRRFGNILYQSYIFEQANMDFHSGLMNAMKFQNDLTHEFQMKNVFNAPRQLILIETAQSYLPAAGRIFSEVLSENFRLYRISAETIAILGPDMNPEQYQIMKDKVKNKIDTLPVGIYTGRSILSGSMTSEAEWIQKAEEDLKDNMNFPETDARVALH